MPWTVEKDDRCPPSRPWAVIKETSGEVEGCHASEEDAQKQQAALYASEEQSMVTSEHVSERAEWDAAYINDLPDGAFAYIEPGGEKDEDGKTVPRSLRHLPHHKADGTLDLPHLRNALARGPQSNVWAQARPHLMKHREEAGVGEQQESSFRPPRDLLVRAQPGGYELRHDERASDDGMPTLFGHFAQFNQWTEIESAYEGHFLERVAPGTFAKAFKESADRIRVTFNHGQDPSIGNKVLGVPSLLEEDDYGARYEVPLFDTTYNRDLLPGLVVGAYGSSFRFRVTKEDRVEAPRRRDDNPEGLPERTITEAEVFEFGPVTYPAYRGATAGVRSMSDAYISHILEKQSQEALLSGAGAEPHSDDTSRKVAVPPRPFLTVEEFVERLRDDA